MEYGAKSARIPKTPQEKEAWKRVIVILEHCPIASVQSDKGFELLSEKHKTTHRRRNQDPAEWRPDVVHQCLLHLQDSALNRAGMLQVFLRTKKGVCIAVDPRLRVPRSMRIFEKMMVSLLYKMKIRAVTGYLSLLRIVKNPITDHIPTNTVFYRVEKDGELVDPFAFAQTLTSTVASPSSSSSNNADAYEALHQKQEQQRFSPFAFVIGGMSKGDVDVEYAAPGLARSLRVEDRGMSAAAVCSVLLHAFEDTWLAEDNAMAAA